MRNLNDDGWAGLVVLWVLVAIGVGLVGLNALLLLGLGVPAAVALSVAYYVFGIWFASSSRSVWQDAIEAKDAKEGIPDQLMAYLFFPISTYRGLIGTHGSRTPAGGMVHDLHTYKCSSDVWYLALLTPIWPVKVAWVIVANVAIVAYIGLRRFFPGKA